MGYTLYLYRLKRTLSFWLKATFNEVFTKYPFKISGPIFDRKKLRWVFILKAKRISQVLKLNAEELVESDHYFENLSKKDKEIVKEQYLIDLLKPKAYLEELPINLENNNIFKIMLEEENKITCGTATYFMTEGRELMNMLSKEDMIKIAFAYFQENSDKLLRNDVYSLRSKNLFTNGNLVNFKI